LIESLVDEGIGISIITYMEIYQGVLRQPDPKLTEAELTAFLTRVPLFPLTLDVARSCAMIREQLRQQNKRVTSRALDLIIAATAVAYDLTLVTRNLADFKDIPGLKLYQPKP
jgi:predicted nucleic acid-binding protein